MTIHICKQHFFDPYMPTSVAEPINNCDFCQKKITANQLSQRDQIGFWMRRNVQWISFGFSPLPILLFLQLAPTKELDLFVSIFSIFILGVSTSVILSRLISSISVSISENTYKEAISESLRKAHQPQ